MSAWRQMERSADVELLPRVNRVVRGGGRGADGGQDAKCGSCGEMTPEAGWFLHLISCPVPAQRLIFRLFSVPVFILNCCQLEKNDSAEASFPL